MESELLAWDAVKQVADVLKGFDHLERRRILRWCSELFEPPSDRAVADERGEGSVASSISTASVSGVSGNAIEAFGSPGELLAATAAKTDAERALVVAAHLQRAEARESLSAFEINSQLKHLGYRVRNITEAIGAHQRARPALMIQIRKSGNSKQARKAYSVTAPGFAKVQSLLDESRPDGKHP